jgi:hypothetical protein
MCMMYSPMWHMVVNREDHTHHLIRKKKKEKRKKKLLLSIVMLRLKVFLKMIKCTQSLFISTGIMEIDDNHE